MGLSGKGWATYLAEEGDLDGVQAALIKERVVRQVMADSGEERRFVVEMLEAMESMAGEAVLDLVDGQPTTLHAALQRYVDGLEGRDELQPRDRIVEELAMLLSYPFPGEAEQA